MMGYAFRARTSSRRDALRRVPHWVARGEVVAYNVTRCLRASDRVNRDIDP
jgi:hypothetical protein